MQMRSDGLSGPRLNKAETNDMDALAQANPALGYGRLTERALLSTGHLPNRSSVECMCQQVETILPNRSLMVRGRRQNEQSYIIPESPLWVGYRHEPGQEVHGHLCGGMREDGNYHVRSWTEGLDPSGWDFFRARAGKYGGMNLSFQDVALRQRTCRTDLHY